MKKGVSVLVASMTIFFITMYFLGFGADSFLLSFKQNAAHWIYFTQKNYAQAASIFISIWLFTIPIGLPVVMPLALLSGLLFGVLYGALYSLVGFLAGSLVSFFLFRYVFSHILHHYYAASIDSMIARIDKLGVAYLLVLYFSSVVPSLVINAIAALSKISWTFFMVIASLGSLPLIVVFAFAGSRLSSFSSVYDVFSAKIILFFITLALLPAVIRYVAQQYEQHNL